MPFRWPIPIRLFLIRGTGRPVPSSERRRSEPMTHPKGKLSSSADAIGSRKMPRSNDSCKRAVSCDGVDMSHIWSFIRGYSRLKRKIVRGRISETAARPNPMRRITARPLLASFAIVSADSDSFSNLSASGDKTLPEVAPCCNPVVLNLTRPSSFSHFAGLHFADDSHGHFHSLDLQRTISGNASHPSNSLLKNTVSLQL